MKSAKLFVLIILLSGCGAAGGGNDAPDVKPDAIADTMEPDQKSDSAEAAMSDLPDSDSEETDEILVSDIITPPGIIRFIQFSDIHFRGVPGNDNGGELKSFIAMLNTIEFPADLVVATGDLIDFMDEKYHTAETTPVDLFVGHMNGLKFPWEANVGNHDYYKNTDPLTVTTDKKAREALYEKSLGHPLYYSKELNGVKLVFLNSMDGSLWNENAALVGSFGKEQLAWLSSELAEGKPTLLFFHHPPDVTDSKEDEEKLCDVLSKHKGVVRGIFGGHLHQFRKGTSCETPYFLTGSMNAGKKYYLLVEYDPVKDAITILNEADLPFITPPEYDCVEGADALADPGGAAGTVQFLKMENAVSDVQGLGQYLGEGLGAIPWIMKIDAFNSFNKTFSLRLTIGSRWSEPSDYYAYIDGSPCVPFDVVFKNPCSTSAPFSADIDLTKFLFIVSDENPDPSWKLLLTAKDVWIEAQWKDTGSGILIGKGIIHMTLLIAKAIADAKLLFIKEYCAGKMEGCNPGDPGMPACPQTPVPEFYEEIPVSCDMYVKGYSVRSAFMLITSIDDEEIHVTASLSSIPIKPSATPASGFFDPELFSTEPGKNCQ